MEEIAVCQWSSMRSNMIINSSRAEYAIYEHDDIRKLADVAVVSPGI